MWLLLAGAFVAGVLLTAPLPVRRPGGGDPDVWRTAGWFVLIGTVVLAAFRG